MHKRGTKHAKLIKPYAVTVEENGQSVVHRTFVGDINIDCKSNPQAPKHLDGARWRFRVTKCSEPNVQTAFRIDFRFVDPFDEKNADTVEIPENIMLLGSDGYPLKSSKDNTRFDVSGHPYCGVAYRSTPPLFLKFVHFEDDRDGDKDFTTFMVAINMANKNGLDKSKASSSGTGPFAVLTIDELCHPDRVFPNKRVNDGQIWFDSMEDMERLKSKLENDRSNTATLPVTCCTTCKLVRLNLSMCSKCKKTVYCSRECQKMDFPNHKKKCTAPSNNVNK